MSEKNSFLKWVGFKGSEENAPSSVERIRELESQLADLRARRDVNSLSKEEFEILATETAMTMIKSAQLREAKALAAADRLINETASQARQALDSAESKARTILSGAENRGRKYLQAAETQAQELMHKAESEADEALESKKREVANLSQAARREGDRIISTANDEAAHYREWLANVISEAGRLYKVQTQSLDAAESAIAQTRVRLDSAFSRLAELQTNVLENLDSNNVSLHRDPIKVKSERTKKSIDAPPSDSKKKVAKKAPAKRK
ncbi:unannotated protein [freshwater metagenome]|uniref:Unannotated protein n=1 Tax=freshwater metagenome TaxID=449393 RepID=A0A6J7XSZ3_9ZZZZ|nr:hypothetical protein [Actinomycetota bacterium]